jgi:hypothetical protein
MEVAERERGEFLDQTGVIPLHYDRGKEKD